MPLTRGQMKAAVLGLLTDPLNKQNTAAKTRAAIDVLIDNQYNMAEDELGVQISPNKDPVKAIALTNVNVSNPGTDTFDTVVFSQGERLILGGQSVLSQNGIYIFDTDSTPLVRSLDANDGPELEGAAVVVQQGSVENRDKIWLQITDDVLLGTSDIVWVVTGGTGGDAIDNDPLP